MRIGDFQRGRAKIPESGADIRFRDTPEAELEAGQDRLRSAVEWGIYRRFRKDGAGTLLNLKPACREGFFSPDGGPAQITTIPGDADPAAWVRGLPPESFDAVFGLDFFQVHGDFPRGLEDLARALKKEGTLFLNFFSADHFALAGSLSGPGDRAPVRDRAAVPVRTATTGEVRESARRCGLQVAAVVPYSSFYGNSLWLELMGSRFRWERILDWLSSDERLFDFALFLEEAVAAKLGAECAPRFAAVLRKSAGEASQDGEAGQSRPLPDGIGIPRERLHAIFTEHARDTRNLVFLHHLWKLAWTHLGESRRPGWKELLPDWIHGEYRAWLAQEGLDAKGMAVVDGWHLLPEMGGRLRHRGIPLGPGLQYEQLRRMLADVFGCFRKAQG
ncbi:MAG TPA: hypothetical protein VJ385_05185 [Fibrobacteria bacterium]|nr:hypothetical protein [Fibrobacteria bacterium]